MSLLTVAKPTETPAERKGRKRDQQKDEGKKNRMDRVPTPIYFGHEGRVLARVRAFALVFLFRGTL